MLIRRFTPDDYADFGRLQNIAYADFAESIEDLRLRDERAPAHCRWARWVADSDGRVVGFADYTQNMFGYHPRKYSLHLGVDPRYFGRGAGTGLYDSVIDELRGFDPLNLDVWARADMSCLITFVERRGFVKNSEQFTSTLDLTAFDPPAWSAALSALSAQALRVTTLEELGATNENVMRQVYDLRQDVRRDMPIPPGEERAPVSFEQWWDQINVPSINPALFVIALDGDRFVGTSQLWYSPDPDELRTGLTGVAQSHRRRGIALGLKVHVLTWGKRLGFKRTITENAAENVGMLAINTRLGFVRHPAWIRYLKSFDEAVGPVQVS